MQAATNLSILAQMSPGFCVDIAAAGGIPALVQLARDSSSEAVQRAAAQALQCLAVGGTRSSVRSIVAAGAIPALARLLHSRSAEVAEQAVFALCSLMTAS